MAAVRWIKLCTDIFDDEKILMIESLPSADTIIVIWFKLLTFAGKQNNDGVFIMNNRIAYTDEMLATIFRRDINVVRLALKTFEDFGMIEIIDGVVAIPNWNKHQTLDAYEKKKERDRLYQQERRAKQRLLVEKSSDKSSYVAVSEEDIEEDIDKEIEKDSNKAKRKRFTPPTLDEVKDYCTERNNNVDAERFIDYYTSNGWMVGKNKMKDWRASVRTWERKEAKKPSQSYQKQSKAEELDDFYKMASAWAEGRE
jgi:predicted phage replisome organizer